LPFKLFILSDIRTNHPLDLLLSKEQAKAEIVDSAVVRDDCEVFGFLLGQCCDQVFWDAAQAKTTYAESASILDVLNCLEKKIREVRCILLLLS
jgi:hypothetical protein